MLRPRNTREKLYLCGRVSRSVCSTIRIKDETMYLYRGSTQLEIEDSEG
jgi:hypothetical protein